LAPGGIAKHYPNSYVVITWEGSAVRTRIIPIGNSQGIRIPKPLLEQTGLHGEVEIRAENGSLVIRPVKKPRAGWAAAFREMRRRGDDALLYDVPPTLAIFVPRPS
jgi:antitoxin MazE